MKRNKAINKIKTVIAQDDFLLRVTFDDGVSVLYDVKDDIRTIPDFKPLENTIGLFKSFSLDKSGTVITWTDRIDLPSDTIREFGKMID